MTTKLVLADDAGPVRILTMNRPEARNSLNSSLIKALYTALAETDADPSVRAVVLTAVDPAFCAGIDVRQAQHEGSTYFEHFQSHNCITRVAEIATPIIGAINGPVFTGGLEMALGCDFLIASERAVFAETHPRVGILPGDGMTARLPQLVGGAVARRLSMTGEVVDSHRAERIGLVTEVVPHDLLLPHAVELATQITEVPTPTMASLKEIYITGTAAVTHPALAAERAIAGAQELDRDGLSARYAEISERNRRQIRPQQT